MANNVTVLIASAQRLPSIRKESSIPGSVLFFSDANLASALESIRAHEPHVVAVETEFAESGEGRAFADRLRALSLTNSEVRMLCRTDGRWSTAPLAGHAAAALTMPGSLNTRRAPRFLVIDPTQAVIDGTATNIIDISSLGAQIISSPVMRPKQRVKVMITEAEDVIRFAARVAWSCFEKRRDAPAPHYRVGMEFDDATQQALGDFCRKHCSEEPLPYRS